MERKKKNILIGSLLAIVLIMAVGYAAFATQLNIDGTANITSTWDVHIKSITPGTPVGTASNVEVTNNGLTATFETELVSPGDSLTYTVVVENSGSLDAVLSDLTFTPGNNDAITYEYSGISQGSVLTSENTATFTITVTYDEDVTSQPQNTTNTLTMQLIYEQNHS